MPVLLVNTNRMKPAIAPLGLDYLADALQAAGHTGAITWTPTDAQGPSTNTVTVRVTDDNPWAMNERRMSAMNSFTVTVRELRLQAALSANELTLSLGTLSGRPCRVETSGDLGAAGWTAVPGYESIDGTGGIQTIHLPVGQGSQRYYRIVLSP
jgi:hypothetical protein